MPRPLRLEYPHALHHITNRGVEQRDIFLDDRDRLRFLAILAEVISETGWRLYAWVLMTNHYHLLVETPEPNLSYGMKDLDGDYASGFNDRHTRVGHLFQGRFKNRLVESETYLLEVARYVVLNPVRASMVATAGDWVWSSYRPTAGLASAPAWLVLDPLLSRFHPRDRSLATAEYRAFVAAATGEEPSPWQHVVAGAFLGSKSFLEMIEEKILQRAPGPDYPRNQRNFRARTLAEVQEAVGLHTDIPGSTGNGNRRPAFVLLARRRTCSGFAEIGRLIGITGAGASYLLKNAEERLQRDPAFAEFIANAQQKLDGREVSPF